MIIQTSLEEALQTRFKIDRQHAALPGDTTVEGNCCVIGVTTRLSLLITYVKTICLCITGVLKSDVRYANAALSN